MKTIEVRIHKIEINVLGKFENAEDLMKMIREDFPELEIDISTPIFYGTVTIDADN